MTHYPLMYTSRRYMKIAKKRHRKARHLYLPKEAIIDELHRKYNDSILELFTGFQGAGKSTALLQHGLQLASYRRVPIVANFPITDTVASYSPWLYRCVYNSRGLAPDDPKRWIYHCTNREQILNFKDCVVLWDEAQYFASEKRQYQRAETGHRITFEFYADVCQRRKGHCDVLLAAHDDRLLDQHVLAQVPYIWLCRKTNAGWRRDRFQPNEYRGFLQKQSDLPGWLLRIKYRTYGLNGKWSSTLRSYYNSHARLDDRKDKSVGGQMRITRKDVTHKGTVNYDRLDFINA